jgi:RimJ/RimL family protein N-acetyltransferase
MRKKSVSLRQIEESDFELIGRWSVAPAGAYSQGMVYTQGIGMTAFSSVGDVARNLGRPGVNCFMVVTEDERRVGAVAWHRIEHARNHLIDVCIGAEEFWTGGYCVETILALLDHLFHEKNAHRVQLAIGMHNKHLMAVVEGGHMAPEAILRDYLFVDGAYHDAVSCALLRDEYYAGRGGDSARDLVPTEDKDEARRLLRGFLRQRSGEYLLGLLDHANTTNSGR